MRDARCTSVAAEGRQCATVGVDGTAHAAVLRGATRRTYPAHETASTMMMRRLQVWRAETRSLVVGGRRPTAMRFVRTDKLRQAIEGRLTAR